MFSLSTHLSVDTSFASTFWLLWIKRLWILVYKFLLSVIWGIYPQVELVNHMMIPCLILWGNAVLFPFVSAPFYIPASNGQGLQFFHTLTDTCYSFIYFFLFIMAILMWKCNKHTFKSISERWGRNTKTVKAKKKKKDGKKVKANVVKLWKRLMF